MRNIDDIFADAHKALGALLREAFEAGKAHTTSDLKAKMIAFVDGLTMSGEAAGHAEHVADSPTNQTNTGDHPGANRLL